MRGIAGHTIGQRLAAHGDSWAAGPCDCAHQAGHEYEETEHPYP